MLVIKVRVIKWGKGSLFVYVFKKYRFLLKNTGLWASKYRFVFPEVGMSAPTWKKLSAPPPPAWNKMTGAFNNMNKDNVLIYFLYIHLIFYKKYMIESLESRLQVWCTFSHIEQPWAPKLNTFFCLSPERSSERDYVITDSVRSM